MKDLNKLHAGINASKDPAGLSAAIGHVQLFTALIVENSMDEHMNRTEHLETEIIASALVAIKSDPTISIYDALNAAYNEWIK